MKGRSAVLAVAWCLAQCRLSQAGSGFPIRSLPPGEGLQRRALH